MSLPAPFHEVPDAAGDSARRRLLLISYHFPPGQATGALRWQKLAGFARERGWALDVITLDPANLREPDWRRVRELPPGTRLFGVSRRSLLVERVEGALARVVRLVRPRRPTTGQPAGGGSSPAPGPEAPKVVARDQIRWRPTHLRDYARAYQAWLAFARDGAWAQDAAKVGRALIGGAAYRAVITCGPPHMTHTAGWRVAAAAGIPFVMDMRDPWGMATSVTAAMASPVWLRTAARHERAAVRHAAFVATNTDPLREAMERAYAGARFVTVMNGFDEETIPAAHRDGRFVIAYAGAIYLDRDPRPLFRAAARVVRDLGLRPDQFGIAFIGHVEQYGGVPLPQLAAEEGLGDYFELGPLRPRAEAMEFLARATMLLSLPQSADLAIPSKVFEYMQFEAWVLALASPASATARVLRDTSADVVAPGAEDQIAAVIRRRYEQHAAGERPARLATDDRFSRRAQARRFFDALDACAP